MRTQVRGWLLVLMAQLGASATWAAAPAAVSDYFPFPTNATSAIAVLANDSDADGDSLSITAVSGLGLSIAPDGLSLRYDSAAATAIPYAYGEYTVSDGTSTATAYVGLSRAESAPDTAPGWPSAYSTTMEVVDPINNLYDRIVATADIVAQKQWWNVASFNPNENPTTQRFLDLPGAGVRYRLTPNGGGGEDCTTDPFSTPLAGPLPAANAVFLGYETILGRALERWFVPDVGSDSDLILTGRRRSIGGAKVLIPHTATYRTANTTTRFVRYVDFVAHKSGTPDPTFFNVPAGCP